MAKNIMIMKKNDGTRPVFVLDLSNQVAFHTQRHLLGKRTVGELTNMMKSFVSVLRTYHIEVTNEEGGQCLLDAVESFFFFFIIKDNMGFFSKKGFVYQ